MFCKDKALSSVLDEIEPFPNQKMKSINGNLTTDYDESDEEEEFQGQELTDFDLLQPGTVDDPNDSVLSTHSSFSETLSSSQSSSNSSFLDVNKNSGSMNTSSLSSMATRILQKAKNTSDSSNQQESLQPNQHRQRHYINILGKQFNSPYNASFQLYQGSLFWFTYRRDFPELMPYKITTDAGWGCMLRATQMLLAHTLRVHYKGREWYPSTVKMERRCVQSQLNQTQHDQSRKNHDDFTCFIASAFADYPGPHFPFSLPNMVATGLRYDKLPGEWYGPGTAAYVLRDLVLIYQRQIFNETRKINKNKKSTSNVIKEKKDVFKVFVAQEGCVYKDVVEDFMTQEGLISSSNASLKDGTTVDVTSSPSSPSNKIDLSSRLYHPLQTQTKSSIKLSPRKISTPQIQWDSSLLLMIPLRLGLQKFNTDYSEALADIFSLPQCVGVLGGSPRHAIWFYGSLQVRSQHNDENEWKLYGLDPHTVQQTPPLQNTIHTKKSHKVRTKKQIVINDSYLSSLHTSSNYNPANAHNIKPVCMNVSNIDPSLALGFYCRDRDEFDELVNKFDLQRLNKSNSNSNNSDNSSFEKKNQQKDIVPKYYNLFSVMETKPEYNKHLSLLVEDDHDDSSDENNEFCSMDESGLRMKPKRNVNNCEEDEYIFV